MSCGTQWVIGYDRMTKTKLRNSSKTDYNQLLIGWPWLDFFLILLFTKIYSNGCVHLRRASSPDFRVRLIRTSWTVAQIWIILSDSLGSALWTLHGEVYTVESTVLIQLVAIFRSLISSRKKNHFSLHLIMKNCVIKFWRSKSISDYFANDKTSVALSSVWHFTLRFSLKSLHGESSARSLQWTLFKPFIWTNLGPIQPGWFRNARFLRTYLSNHCARLLQAELINISIGNIPSWSPQPP